MLPVATLTVTLVMLGAIPQDELRFVLIEHHFILSLCWFQHALSLILVTPVGLSLRLWAQYAPPDDALAAGADPREVQILYAVCVAATAMISISHMYAVAYALMPHAYRPWQAALKEVKGAPPHVATA